jgi:hypothetical protein
MISLERIRTVEVVHSNFRGTKRIALNLKLLRQKRDGELDSDNKDKWDTNIWKQAKEQLLNESNQKCAYCESPTTVIAYGDVEHFRPKSVYWWLAYSYENYLPSCTVCNQRFKKDFFPLLDKTVQWKGPRVTATMTDDKLQELAAKLTVDPINDADGLPLNEFIDHMNSEYALIINPYFEEPAEYLAYEPILETKEVVVVPTLAKHKPIVEACETYFGINRKELMDLRFIRYTEYMTFKYALEDNGLAAQTRQMLKNRLTEMQANFSAYAGMIRYFETRNLQSLPWDFNLIID